MSFFSRNTKVSTSADAERQDADFVFTHEADVSSSLVTGLWYNRDEQKLAVALDEEVYVYDGVPANEFDNLRFAASVGRAYQGVKRNYGPGEYLGWEPDLEIEAKSYEAPSMEPVVGNATVGTPKGLTYAADAVVDGEPVDRKFTLGLVEETPERTTHRHAVVFEVEGLEGVRKVYNVDAGSWTEAEQALTESTDALGLNVTVKEITVFRD